MTQMVRLLHKNHCLRGHEIYNFGRPFLGHHYYILGLSDLCLGEEKKIYKKNNAFSLYDIWPHPSTRTLARGREIYNFGRPFLDHNYYILGLSDLCLGVEKKIVKEIQ